VRVIELSSRAQGAWRRMPQPRAALVLVALTATVLASSQERAVPASGTSLLAKVGLSGAIACSFSHTLVTPLDVIKTQMQLHPGMGAAAAARRVATSPSGTLRIGRLFHGAKATAVGYSLQGAAKFGGFEFGKRIGARWTGSREEWRVPVLLGSAALAEVFASCFLCPLELLKLRVQTDPKFLSLGVRSSLAHIVRAEGAGALFQGFGPVVMRQLPYTVCKLVCYELVADALSNAVEGFQRRRSADPASPLGTAPLMPAIVLAAGLCAGAAAAVVSQPGDVLLTKMCGASIDPEKCKIAVTLWDQARAVALESKEHPLPYPPPNPTPPSQLASPLQAAPCATQPPHSGH